MKDFDITKIWEEVFGPESEIFGPKSKIFDGSFSARVFDYPIPSRKLKQFQKILGDCGGYFLSNPVKESEEIYRVSYEFPKDSKNYKEFQERWRRANQEITEIPQKKSLWKTIRNWFK